MHRRPENIDIFKERGEREIPQHSTFCPSRLLLFSYNWLFRMSCGVICRFLSWTSYSVDAQIMNNQSTPEIPSGMNDPRKPRSYFHSSHGLRPSYGCGLRNRDLDLTITPSKQLMFSGVLLFSNSAKKSSSQVILWRPLFDRLISWVGSVEIHAWLTIRFRTGVGKLQMSVRTRTRLCLRSMSRILIENSVSATPYTSSSMDGWMDGSGSPPTGGTT